MATTDIVNKKYNSCGCIFTSELNLFDNYVHDNYIPFLEFIKLDMDKLYTMSNSIYEILFVDFIKFDFFCFFNFNFELFIFY
jgi:hypothetical protein